MKFRRKRSLMRKFPRSFPVFVLQQKNQNHNFISTKISASPHTCRVVYQPDGRRARLSRQTGANAWELLQSSSSSPPNFLRSHVANNIAVNQKNYCRRKLEFIFNLIYLFNKNYGKFFGSLLSSPDSFFLSDTTHI